VIFYRLGNEFSHLSANIAHTQSGPLATLTIYPLFLVWHVIASRLIAFDHWANIAGNVPIVWFAGFSVWSSECLLVLWSLAFGIWSSVFGPLE